MSKRAIILAGGKGTRLHPYTVVFPKPLVPIGDYPVLEIIIRQLSRYGFDHITLAVNHHAELIETFFGDGSKWNVKIDYSLEDKPLSTMGPLKLLKDLPDNFLVMNGDVLTDLDFNDFYNFHTDNGHLFTLAGYTRTHRIDYGVLQVNDKNHLTGFSEKPTISHQVSMGIYMIHKSIIDLIPKDKPYGFDHLMLDLIKNKKSVFVKNYTGYWLDIGRPDDYAQAIEEFEKNKKLFI